MATKTDYTKLSDNELNAMLAGVTAELDKRKEAEKQKAIDQIKAIAESAGLSLAAVAKGTRKPKAKAVAPKYRNPNNPEQTWSGRGKKPRWLVDSIAAGRSLESHAI